jgi:hypothetical protein
MRGINRRIGQIFEHFALIAGTRSTRSKALPGNALSSRLSLVSVPEPSIAADENGGHSPGIAWEPDTGDQRGVLILSPNISDSCLVNGYLPLFHAS